MNNFTWTQSSISSETRFAAAVEVSSGIYAGCILIAVVATVAAFVDIWIIREWRKQMKVKSFYQRDEEMTLDKKEMTEAKESELL